MTVEMGNRDENCRLSSPMSETFTIINYCFTFKIVIVSFYSKQIFSRMENYKL